MKWRPLQNFCIAKSFKSNGGHFINHVNCRIPLLLHFRIGPAPIVSVLPVIRQSGLTAHGSQENVI